MTDKPFHLYRPRGGLGDIVRLTAVIDAAALRWPDRPIRFHAPAEYEGLVVGYCAAFQTHPNIAFQPVRFDGSRHIAPVLRGEPDLVNLYGPEVEDEKANGGVPTRSRVEVWAEAAGVTPFKPALVVPEVEPRPIVVLHNRPAGRIRQAPDELFHGVQSRIIRLGLLTYTVQARLPWRSLVELLASAGAVVAVDSGIFHLAAALGRPVLGLFGPTSADVTCRDYRSADRRVRGQQIVSVSSPCYPPCYARNNRGYDRGGLCRSGCAALAALTPDGVFSALRKLLEDTDEKGTPDEARPAQ